MGDTNMAGTDMAGMNMARRAGWLGSGIRALCVVVVLMAGASCINDRTQTVLCGDGALLCPPGSTCAGTQEGL